METFPINLGLLFTFFSLIAKANPDYCKQTIDYLTHMDQYCEYFDELDQNEFITNGEAIKLTKSRKLFGIFKLDLL